MLSIISLMKAYNFQKKTQKKVLKDTVMTVNL